MGYWQFGICVFTAGYVMVGYFSIVEILPTMDTGEV
jgi:hypothetical protein